MNLQHYVSVIFTASVLGAVCAALAGSTFEPYIRYLAALACILLIVHPFRSFSFALPEEESVQAEGAVSADSLQTLAGELAETEICRAIGEMLLAQTGITACDIRIDMEWTEREAVITAVYLTVGHEADAASAEAWAEGTYGVPCEVTWKGETA